jgi:hypothetical protein
MARRMEAGGNEKDVSVGILLLQDLQLEGGETKVGKTMMIFCDYPNLLP